MLEKGGMTPLTNFVFCRISEWENLDQKKVYIQITFYKNHFTETKNH